MSNYYQHQSEQGQANLAARTKKRSDTYRIRQSTKLSELDDGKKISIEVGLLPIAVELGKAARCVGCVIEGFVTVSTRQASLTLGGTVVDELLFTGSPSLVTGTNTFTGAALVIPNVAVGTWFRAVSTGLRWHISVTNPAAAVTGVAPPAPSGTIAVTQSRTLTAEDAGSSLSIDLGLGNVTITLPDASLVPGTTIRGGVVSNILHNNLTVTCSAVQQMIGTTTLRDENGTPTLATTIRNFRAEPLVLLAPDFGAVFQAFSVGTHWFVTASGLVDSS